MSDLIAGPEPDGITRSMRAEKAPQAAAVARRRQAQPNGWWGMALFVAAEATLFGTLLATYYYLDFGSVHWPPPGIKPPTLAWPLIATGWLVLTSIPMWMSSRAARVGNRSVTGWVIALAMVMQVLYLAAQIFLFQQDLLKFSPKGSAYGSIYFTMLAADHAHVLLGILLDFGVLWHVLTRGLTNYWLIGVRGIALYWHVVNVITVLVTLTQLTPAL